MCVFETILFSFVVTVAFIELRVAYEANILIKGGEVVKQYFAVKRYHHLFKKIRKSHCPFCSCYSLASGLVV